MADRKKLAQIASTAWEHPADRAALNALRAIPGFDQVVRKVASFFGEKGIRQIFLANAVRVGTDAAPEAMGDVPGGPGDPRLARSAGALRHADAARERRRRRDSKGRSSWSTPESIELLEPEEQRDILGHELGHIMSGHTTYTTIAIIILTVGLQNLPFLAGMALFPFQLALLEWYRKAELSADRAGLLVTQDARVTMSTFLKMAGGREYRRRRSAWTHSWSRRRPIRPKGTWPTRCGR